MTALHAVSNNPRWEDLEEAEVTFRSISSMVLLILNEMESNTDEYSALEGVALLADIKQKQLQQMIAAN